MEKEGVEVAENLRQVAVEAAGNQLYRWTVEENRNLPRLMEAVRACQQRYLVMLCLRVENLAVVNEVKSWVMREYRQAVYNWTCNYMVQGFMEADTLEFLGEE